MASPRVGLVHARNRARTASRVRATISCTPDHAILRHTPRAVPAPGVEFELPLEAACVLHFESCPYARWEEKFTHYARTTTRLSKIPFLFYVDSIKCCRQHAQVSSEAGPPRLDHSRPADEQPRAAQDTSQLRSFWRKRKQRHYLREADQVLVIGHLALPQETRERLERQRVRRQRTARGTAQ